MGLETFIERAREYELKKVKVIEKKIEGFGTIRFTRPPQVELLEYLESLASQAKPQVGTDSKDGDIEVNLTIGVIAMAASKLVYNCCVDLQSKEIREMFKGIDNYEIPLEMFGSGEIMRLGNFISTEFGSLEIKRKVTDEVKNLLEGTVSMEGSIG